MRTTSKRFARAMLELRPYVLHFWRVGPFTVIIARPDESASALGVDDV